MLIVEGGGSTLTVAWQAGRPLFILLLGSVGQSDPVTQRNESQDIIDLSAHKSQRKNADVKGDGISRRRRRRGGGEARAEKTYIKSGNLRAALLIPRCHDTEPYLRRLCLAPLHSTPAVHIANVRLCPQFTIKSLGETLHYQWMKPGEIIVSVCCKNTLNRQRGA